jgi:hypothetical protein
MIEMKRQNISHLSSLITSNLDRRIGSKISDNFLTLSGSLPKLCRSLTALKASRRGSDCISTSDYANLKIVQ